MYQALYRKYRPSTFDEVVGQDVIVRTLKNAIQNNRLTHAYLFTGPRGTGKTSTAKILAKTINCKNLNGLEPCNQCDSCLQINNKQTTDIIEIDAASNNGVDEIREIKSKVNLVPSNSKYKVYIIDEVHMLSTGAFNALLKTLEEPPSHVVFILATTEPHKIPATILSRCQRFDFKKISTTKIVENLKRIVEKEKIAIEENALLEIAVLAQGGMRDSIGLLDQAVAYCTSEITVQDLHAINGTIGIEQMQKIVECIFQKDIVSLLKMFDTLDEQGKNLIRLVEELTYFLRNILIYEISPSYFNEEERQQYKKIIEEQNQNKITQDELIAFLHEFSKTIYEMKNSDNEKITLELHLIALTNQSTNLKETPVQIERQIPLKEEIKEKNDSVRQVEKEDKKIELEKKETSEPIVQPNIQSEKERQQIEEKNKKIEQQIKEIKQIRINNTLSCFNKKSFLEYKNKIQLVKKHLVDENYSQWVSLILDGELKALGKNHLIFVYKDKPMADLFNHNWTMIEQILNKTYGEVLKVVATDIDDWNIIKQEFNSKTKTYSWKEEPKIENDSNNIEEKKDLNEIERIFSDIIEYSEV